MNQMLVKCLYITLLLTILVSSSSCHSGLHKLQMNSFHQIASIGSSMSLNDGNRNSIPELFQETAKKWGQVVVNVDDFGAKGDGTDDSKAFLKAWKKACSSKIGVLLVPHGRTYLLKPITFSGPCQSNLTIRIQGTIKASPNMSDYERDRRHWITFHHVDDFSVDGGGTINGNGKIWWQNSCKINKNLPCIGAPTALTFDKCRNFRVSNLWIKNPQQMHLTFFECQNVEASYINVTAPETSPNTDGINVNATRYIHIKNSNIATGDDCISIVNGSRGVEARDILCGPGHGISIGSLGKNHGADSVSDVIVDGATLIGTTNGARIKTWQGGRGYAKNITFQNILMKNVANPIIIDQNYCDPKGSCPQQKEAVQVKDVVYRNIRGTSASEVAMQFNCSSTASCGRIVVDNVRLFRQDDGFAKANCANVRLTIKGDIFPQCDQSD